MLVDHHCHLDFPDFAPDLDGVVGRARSAGVGMIVTISTRIRRFDGLLEMARKPFAAVLHCFTGGPELARRALAIGLYVSFSGIVTFKKSDALREIARTVPLDRLLVETDAPYLAPGKYRGKRNEPAYVVETAKELAKVKGVSEAEIALATTENFFRRYAKTPRTALAA